MSGSAKPVRLLYLTYNENVLDSGILYNQVNRMLTEMAKRHDIEYIRLLSFISPRLWLGRRQGYMKLRLNLHNKGIDFRVRLMPAAQTWKWLAVPTFTICCLPVVLIHILFGRFDIVHARGYGASLLGYLATRLVTLKFIFDPRGPFPDEMVYNGSWKADSFTLKLWKAIESKIVRSCDTVVAVTSYSRRVFLADNAKKAIFVPNRTDVDRFLSTSKKSSIHRIDFLFIGEMDSRWNSPERVIFHYKYLKHYKPELKLRLITRKDPNYVQNKLNDLGINKGDWTLEASRPDEIPDRIAGSGVGLVVANRSSAKWLAWPLKFAEYLSAGIPLVIEKTVGKEITDIVSRWKLGLIIDESDPESYSQISEIFDNHEGYKQRCIAYARKRMQISHSAAQYARLYRELLKQGSNRS